MSLLRFTFLFLGYIAGIAVAIFFLADRNGSSFIIPGFWIVFAALALITWLAYMASWLGIRRSPQASVYTILASVVVKLLFCMSLALLYLLKINVNKVTFVIDFISIYFLFSGFEMWALLTNLRHQNKSE